MRNNLSSDHSTMNAFSPALWTLILLISISYSNALFGQGNLTISANKEVVQKWFDMVNKHDLSEMNKVFAADYIWHTMDGKDIRSTQDTSHVAFLRSVLSAVPNSHYKIVSIIGEGDIVAVNTISTGTVQSPSGQKNINVKQMFFYRLSGGLIIEEWEVLDTDLMWKQMGRICPDYLGQKEAP